MDPNLPDLVRAAADGDAEAYQKVVVRVQDLAYAAALAWLGDYHLAEDATQEALVEAWRDLRARKLANPAAFVPWLRAIVRHQCARLVRRKRLPREGVEAAEALASTEPEPQRALEARESSARVLGALMALPEPHRLALVLFYVSGYSTEQIAEFLGVPVTTVKKRLHDGRAKLQERMMSEVDRTIHDHAPSRNDALAGRVRKLIQPQTLTRPTKLTWSAGIGTDVWAMLEAAAGGDIETMRRLFAKDAGLVSAQEQYRTPLHFAVRENQLAAAAWLLEHGADPSYHSGSGYHDSPLTIARARGYVEMATLLEAKLASAHRVSPRGEAIAGAIRARDVAQVKALLEAEPTLLAAADQRGNQPLHWAVLTRQPELIDLLLARGADIDAERVDGARPAHLTGGDYFFRAWKELKDAPIEPIPLLESLLARGARYDLPLAAGLGDLPRVRELLDLRPDAVNELPRYISWYRFSGPALRNAVESGNIEVVRLLLERGADPNLPEEGHAPSGSALFAAVGARNRAMIDLLLEHGADPNQKVESCGDCLSSAADTETRNLLASYGAAITMDTICYSNDTVTAAAILAANPAKADDPENFAYAAGRGNRNLVRLYLAYRPDLPKRMGPCSTTDAALARELLARGMDPNRHDWLRVTALHQHAMKGQVEMIALYLDHGAVPSPIDDELCSTPLGWAARFSQRAVVELLLARGVPLRAGEPDWAAPLAWAQRRGHHEIAALLAR